MLNISSHRLSENNKGILYALPVLATSFLGSASAVLQGIYAKDFGLALTSIAMVLLVSRLFDAVTDPLVGCWSDWYCAQGGSRKPFIICGSVLFIISGYFLYVPPGNVSVGYFLGCYLAFTFALTLFDIPHLAWANDLVNSSAEKTTFYGWRSFMLSVGLMSFFIIPLLPVFETSAITPETLKWSVLVAGGLLSILLPTCIRFLPSGNINPLFPASGNSTATDFPKESPSQLFRSVRTNLPLLLFFAAFFCCGFAGGMCMTLLFLFIDSYLGLGLHFALLYVISHIFSISSVGLWATLANRWSKQKIWGLAMVLLICGMFGMGLFSPANVSQPPLLLCLIFLYCGFAAWMVVAPALLSDIIDYSTWKFGRDRSATYFSLYSLISKTNAALGSAVGMATAAWFGFEATATVHSVENALGLRLGIAWLPMPFLLLSMLFMAKMPITARRHAIVRRRLNRLPVPISEST